MEYRSFGKTGMQLSVVSLGGLLARFEGANGHPPPQEKRQIYLRAAELGVNLFDMGYGDEIHIPDELKGNGGDHYFAMKAAAPSADELEGLVDKYLGIIRRDRLDVLRIHHYALLQHDGLAERIQQLKQAGKVGSLCVIRHGLACQQAYAERGPEPESDADLVIYNYVCRWQEPGIQMSGDAGTGVLIMKALGSQWISWEDKVNTDWSQATDQTFADLNPWGEAFLPQLPLARPIIAGPWHELAEPGESIPPTERAISWVLNNPAVTSVMVAFASVAEVEEGLGIKELV